MIENPSFQICVLGSANSDHFLEVQNFPKGGETIAAKKAYIKNGGKGANQAVAASLLGSSTIFCGQIGNDQDGELLVQEMTQAKVNLSALRRVKEQTGQAIIMLDHTGENSIIIISGANTAYDNHDVLPEEFIQAIHSADFLQMQMEIPQQINAVAAQQVQCFLNQTKKDDKFSMLDCGGKAEKLHQYLLYNVSFVSPNETELERIIGEEIILEPDYETYLLNVNRHLERIVHEKVFIKYTDIIVLLKLGSKGSMLVTKEFSIKCPTVTMMNQAILDEYKIVDTVGAGDCFTSGFCTQFYRLVKQHCEVRVGEFQKLDVELRKQIFQSSMKFASAAAFLCITQHGAMPAMPKAEDVAAFMKKYL